MAAKKTTKKPAKKAAKKKPAKKKAAKKPKLRIPTATDYLKQLQTFKDVDPGDYAMFDDPLAHVSPVEEWIPSGILALDKLTGGGWPVGRVIEVAAWEGVGKALPLSMPVLTPSGWRLHGDLKEGDLVVGADGKPKRVLQRHPTLELAIFRIELDDGSHIDASRQHLWKVKNYHGTDRVISTEDLLEKPRRKGGGPAWYIENHAPLEYPPRDLPIAPYALGVLLGDGCLGQRTNSEPDVVARLREASDCEKKAASLKDKITSLDLRKGSHEKHIPKQYFRGSIAQRCALLEGLIDTDGFVPNEGCQLIAYSTTAPLLRDGVVRLVRSLGGKVRVSPRQTYCKGKPGRPSWRLYIKLPQELRLSAKHSAKYEHCSKSLSRAVVAVTPNRRGPVCCISVEDELYVAGPHVVTHNSTLLDQTLAMAQSLGFVGCLSDTEQARDASYTQRLGVDVKKLIVAKTATVEESFAAIDRMLVVQEKNIELLKKSGRRPPAMVIVWDSVGGTPTAEELKGGPDDRHVASAAKVIKMNLRRLTARLPDARATLLLANQFYQGIGPFASLQTYGGSGIRYFTSLRVWLSRIGQIKRGNDVLGHVIKAKLKKTRVGHPNAPVELGLIYGAGIHNAWSLYQWGLVNGHPELKGHKWLTSGGAWAYLHLPNQEPQAFQGTFMGFGDILAANPSIYQTIASAFMDRPEPLSKEPNGNEEDDQSNQGEEDHQEGSEEKASEEKAS